MNAISLMAFLTAVLAFSCATNNPSPPGRGTGPASTPAPRNPPASDKKELQSLTSKYMLPLLKSSGKGWFPGIIVGMIHKGNTYVMQYGTLKGVSEKAQFPIASLTKTFTATLLAEAVIAEKLTLNTPLLACAANRGLCPGNMPVTLRHLAQHYSGLPVLPPGAWSDRSSYTLKKLDRFTRSTILTTAPGTKFTYSTVGYALLGNHVGRAHGTTWEGALKKRILTPLGLSRTSTSPGDGAHIIPGFTTDGSPYVKPLVTGVFAPSGGLYSTISDLLIFLRANIVPPSASWKQVFALVHNPELARPSFPGSTITLGWHHFLPMKLTWHSGTSGGYKTFIAFSSKNRTGVVIVANRALAPSDPRLEMAGFMLLAKAMAPEANPPRSGK